MTDTLSFKIRDTTTTITFPEREHLFSCDAPATLAVFDEHTARLCPSMPPGHVVTAAGESRKEWPTVERILRAALSAGLGRDGTIIGVGGGVVCDTTAFAASIYMRGCTLILVPTTLLAMVDAAFGGKTGINFDDLKNIVGTFYPATEIRINIELLATLPEHEYRSGLVEVIKSGLLRDAELVSILEQKRDAILARDPATVRELVRRSIAVKGGYVEEDPTEKGVRAHLNLGHTFGHAVESVVGFGTWTHGEAVAWGIARAMDAGELIGVTDRGYAARVRELLQSYGYRIERPAVPFSADELMNRMKSDKKKKNGTVHFVLQRGLCDTIIEPLTDDQLHRIL